VMLLLWYRLWNASEIKKWDTWEPQKHNGVPRRTLERYVNYRRPAKELVEVHLGRKPHLPAHLEEELVEYCIAMQERFSGLRSSDIRRLCYQWTVRNGLAHPFSRTKESAGKNSWEHFSWDTPSFWSKLHRVIRLQGYSLSPQKASQLSLTFMTRRRENLKSQTH
jgi:hypothetical protein